MKKLVSLFVSVMMMLSVCTAAFAESEMEKALAQVKLRIGNTDMYDEFGSSENNYDGNTLYSFNWSTSDKENRRNLSVSVTAGGVITEYYAYSMNTMFDSSVTDKKHTTAEAIEAAEKFFAQLNPDIAANVKVERTEETEPLERRYFNFRLQRYENGIPVQGDDGTISVSPELDVESFYMTYTENITFDTTQNIIDAEAAKKAFFEKIGMELFYSSTYEDGEKKIVPLYNVKEDFTYINPYSGEAYKPKTYSSIPYRYANGATADMAMKASVEEAAVEFSQAEITELEKVAELMSVEEAEALIRKNEVLALADELILTNNRMAKRSENDIDTYIYTMFFADEKREKSAQASLDAKTGEILYFNRYKDNKTENKLEKEKAQEIAKNAAEKLAAYLSEYKLESDEEYSREYVRYVNGIPYYDDSLVVNVNAYDGSIEYYSISRTNADFPSIENCITPEAAYEKLIEKHGMKLFYIPERLTEKAQRAEKMTLLYSPETDGNWNINAFDGSFFNERAELSDYSDIENHYASDAIKSLKTYGIGYSGGLFKPHENITVKDFAVLVQNVLKWHSAVIIDEEEISFLQAKMYGFVNNEADMTAPITRMEAAELIIKALELSEYAKLPIYVAPFSDIPAENTGVAALLYGMGIIKGDGNGLFNPSGLLSRGDAAILVHNYIIR